MMTLKQFSDKEILKIIIIIVVSLTIIIFFSYRFGYSKGITESYMIINQSFQNFTCINTYNPNLGWMI